MHPQRAISRNDRRQQWHQLLPAVLHNKTTAHGSTRQLLPAVLHKATACGSTQYRRQQINSSNCNAETGVLDATASTATYVSHQNQQAMCPLLMEANQGGHTVAPHAPCWLPLQGATCIECIRHLSGAGAGGWQVPLVPPGQMCKYATPCGTSAMPSSTQLGIKQHTALSYHSSKML